MARQRRRPPNRLEQIGSSTTRRLSEEDEAETTVNAAKTSWAVALRSTSAPLSCAAPSLSPLPSAARARPDRPGPARSGPARRSWTASGTRQEAGDLRGHGLGDDRRCEVHLAGRRRAGDVGQCGRQPVEGFGHRLPGVGAPHQQRRDSGRGPALHVHRVGGHRFEVTAPADASSGAFPGVFPSVFPGSLSVDSPASMRSSSAAGTRATFSASRRSARRRSSFAVSSSNSPNTGASSSPAAYNGGSHSTSARTGGPAVRRAGRRWRRSTCRPGVPGGRSWRSAP